MSVYIKGMEMPTRCWDCLLNTFGYCMASKHSDIIPSDAPIPEWCPLVPVPEHGRLIDADALAERFWDGQCYFTDAIKSKLQSAPTIIPAEEGEG